MTLIKNILLIFIGLSAGGVISGGVFAFITMIGVIPRLTFRTGTAKYISVVEDSIMLGGILGNIVAVFEPGLPIGIIGLLVYGLFSGIFVGCLSMALAEALKVIPVFVRRVKLTQGLPIVILSIAIAKALGAFYQLYMK